MKKITSVILLLLLALPLISCDKSEPKEITCEDIIRAYEDAGYYVTHSAHKEESETSQLCYIKASLTEDSDSDFIYFITCFNEQQAKEAEKNDKYNPIIWFYAAINGEVRWLKADTYGKIEYSYYNSELVKPFKELIK